MIDIEKISDSDFDYLCDLALNFIYASAESFDFSQETALEKQIKNYLYSEHYNFDCELDLIHTEWWDDMLLECAALDLNEDQSSKNAEDQEDPYANFIEVSLIATRESGAHKGERVVVASLVLPIIDPNNIQEKGIGSPTLQWLPERNTLK